MHFMAKTIMARTERLRKIRKEAEQRFAHELLDDEERQLLRDRVRRLGRKLGTFS